MGSQQMFSTERKFNKEKDIDYFYYFQSRLNLGQSSTAKIKKYVTKKR
jgi:hypothetical protein